MKRPALLALLLLLALALAVGLRAWMASDGGGAAAGPEGDSARPGEVVAPAGAPDTVEEVGIPNPPTESTPAGARQELAGFTEPDEVLPSLRPGEGLRVEVVTDQDHEPIPGAIVTVPGAIVTVLAIIDVDRFELESGLRGGGSIRGLIERWGTAYRAGEDGVAVVPFTQGMTLLSGSSPGRWGVFETSGGRDDVLLVLERDEALTVRVVDGAGRGVPEVSVAIRHGEGETANDLWAKRTSSRGVTAFPTVFLREWLENEGDLRAALGIPLLEPVETPIDPERLTAELELVLPPTVALIAHLVDAAGEPVRRPVYAHLEFALADGERPPRERTAVYGQVATAVDGIARLPYVEPGLEAELVARYADGRAEARRAVSLPSEPGSVLELELAFGVLEAELLARLLGHEGEPLAEAEVHYRLLNPPPDSNPAQPVGGVTRTDGEGQVQIAAAARPAGGAARQLLHLWTGWEDRPEQEAKVELPVLTSSGPLELGDIHLRAPPLLAAGRVVGPRGEPLAGARVHMWFFEEHRDGDPGAGQWRRAFNADTLSDSQGEFEARGGLGYERLRLSATREGYHLEQPVEAFAGDRGVLIQLGAAGAVEGSLLLDEGVPHDALSLLLFQEESDRRSPAQLDELARFAWLSLVPGRVRVTIGVAGEGEPLLEVDDVLVIGGETTRDERLQEVDLRGRVQRLELTVREPGGEPVRGVAVYLGEVGRWSQRGSTDGDGRLTLFGSELRGEVLLIRRGFRDLHFPATPGEHEVVLQLGYPVRFALTPVPDLQGGARLMLSVTPSRPEVGSGRRTGDLRSIFDERGETLLHLGSPGAHLVRLYVASRGGGQADAGPFEIEVLDLDAEQLFRIELTGEQLEAIEKGE